MDKRKKYLRLVRYDIREKNIGGRLRYGVIDVDKFKMLSSSGPPVLSSPKNILLPDISASLVIYDDHYVYIPDSNASSIEKDSPVQISDDVMQYVFNMTVYEWQYNPAKDFSVLVFPMIYHGDILDADEFLYLVVGHCWTPISVYRMSLKQVLQVHYYYSGYLASNIYSITSWMLDNIYIHLRHEPDASDIDLAVFLAIHKLNLTKHSTLLTATDWDKASELITA